MPGVTVSSVAAGQINERPDPADVFPELGKHVVSPYKGGDNVCRTHKYLDAKRPEKTAAAVSPEVVLIPNCPNP